MAQYHRKFISSQLFSCSANTDQSTLGFHINIRMIYPVKMMKHLLCTDVAQLNTNITKAIVNCKQCSAHD